MATTFTLTSPTSVSMNIGAGLGCVLYTRAELKAVSAGSRYRCFRCVFPSSASRDALLPVVITKRALHVKVGRKIIRSSSMKGDYLEYLQCPQPNPVDLFRPGHIVKICAPMVRYSKLAFRTLVRKYYCDLCYTPMIVATDFVKSVKARDSEFTTNQGDRPLIVQFAAKEAQTLADAACMVSPFADGVDLNCGCPQRWALAEGYGACLINKPDLVKDMVRQVRNQVDMPTFSVSIKIRIHEDITRTVDLCRKAEAAGVSWITVHGRSVEERHQPVHYEEIKTIKDSMSIPVVANGDIRNLKEVEHVHEMTGADGIMAARGLLANPAMFAGYEETPLRCIQDWIDIALQHGTPFTCLHHHLMYMMERISSRQEKRVFNVLSSTSAVLDYLREHYGV